jgi:hypothetical protein
MADDKPRAFETLAEAMRELARRREAEARKQAEVSGSARSPTGSDLRGPGRRRR